MSVESGLYQFTYVYTKKCSRLQITLSKKNSWSPFEMSQHFSLEYDLFEQTRSLLTQKLHKTSHSFSKSPQQRWQRNGTCICVNTYLRVAKDGLDSKNMGVSKNRGTPKSSILLGFSMKWTIYFGGPPLFLVQHPYIKSDFGNPPYNQRSKIWGFCFFNSFWLVNPHPKRWGCFFLPKRSAHTKPQQAPMWNEGWFSIRICLFLSKRSFNKNPKKNFTFLAKFWWSFWGSEDSSWGFILN